MSHQPLVTGFAAHGYEVLFGVLRGSRGEYGDWRSSLRSNTRGIPGSDSTVTQVSGFREAQLTMSLEFDNRAVFRTFVALWGRVGTLTLLDGFTTLQGVHKVVHERDYEQFHDTMLMDIADAAHEPDGTVTCVATFQRAYTRPSLDLPLEGSAP